MDILEVGLKNPIMLSLGFEMIDIGLMSYNLRLKVNQMDNSIFISQRSVED